MRRLDILFIVEEIYPDVTGGVHTYVYNIAKGLVLRGHKIVVLTRLARPGLPKQEEIDGFSVYRYGFRNSPFSIIRLISCILNIKKETDILMKKRRFDLINFHSPQAALGLALSETAGSTSRVYTFHALLNKEESLTVKAQKYDWHNWKRYAKFPWLAVYFLFLKWLDKKAVNSCDKLITLSQFTAKSVRNLYNIDAGKMIQIPAGVDTGTFKPPRDKNKVKKILKIPKDKKVIFTLRRLVPRMGLGNLINAMPSVLRRHPKTMLLVGGDGPLKQHLYDLIKKSNLKDSVKLLGHISQARLPLYYQAADLFVLPSVGLEGFGLVTLEALSCGVPVLGTPVGGTIEILRKLDENLLFKGTGPESIADLIVTYIGKLDNIRLLNGRCRQFILDNYSWAKSAEKTEELFLNIFKFKQMNAGKPQ